MVFADLVRERVVGVRGDVGLGDVERGVHDRVVEVAGGALHDLHRAGTVDGFTGTLPRVPSRAAHPVGAEDVEQVPDGSAALRGAGDGERFEAGGPFGDEEAQLLALPALPPFATVAPRVRPEPPVDVAEMPGLADLSEPHRRQRPRRGAGRAARCLAALLVGDPPPLHPSAGTAEQPGGEADVRRSGGVRDVEAVARGGGRGVEAGDAEAVGQPGRVDGLSAAGGPVADAGGDERLALDVEDGPDPEGHHGLRLTYPECAAHRSAPFTVT